MGATSGPQWGIRPSLYGKTSLPHNHFTYGLLSGTRLVDGVVLLNFQSRPQRLSVYAADMVPIQGGGFAPAQVYQTMHQVGAWVHLRRRSVLIPPDSTVRDAFTIAVPHGTPPGEYFGAIVAAARSATTGAMGVETRAALVVHLVVPGKIALHVALGPLRSSPYQGGQQFSLVLRNRGNVTFTFRSSVRVQSNGHTVANLPAGPADTYVVPGGYSILHALWRGAPALGRDSASMTVHILINGKTYRTYKSDTLTLTFIPWLQILLAAVALLLALGLSWLIRPRLRRYLVSRREEREIIAAYRARRQQEESEE